MAGAAALSPGDAASRGYRVALAVLAAGTALLAGWVATREWFSRDDFLFLAYVQATDPWSWRQVYLPFDERFWAFYRPLSMETFFRLAHAGFGLDARGYFGISLALHFASGPLVFRVARQLGLGAALAWAGALLAVTRPGTFDEIYYGSVFMYVIESFLALVCVSAFLDARTSRSRSRAQLLSCAALVLALCSNEHAVILPAVLSLAAALVGPDARLRDAARALPQWAILGFYALFRFVWIAPVEAPAPYAPSLHSDLLANAAQLLAGVFGGVAALAVALALAGAAIAVGLPALGSSERRAWWRRAGFTAGWLALAIAPFALLVAPQGRWSMPLVFPAALLWAVCFEPAWRRGVVAHRRTCETALVVLLAASLPVPTLVAHGREPVAGPPRRLADWIGSHGSALPERAALVFLHGERPLALPDEAERFRYLAYGGGLLNALDPHTRRVMRMHDTSRRAARNALRADSVYLVLRPDLDFEIAPSRWLDRALRRGFERR